jgi:hypothetical protein
LLRLLAAADNAAMLTEPPKADPPKRKRRWFQFSLRSLLTFTAIGAVGCGWVARKMEHKRREQDAVEAIRKAGGVVAYDYQLDSDLELIADLQPTGPKWLQDLFGENYFDEVAFVEWTAEKLRDDDLHNVEGLTQLKVLKLMGTGITDNGLAHIKGLTQLQKLLLIDTNVSDAGLESLKGLTQLQLLWIGNAQPQVSDGGVAELQKSLQNCTIVYK